MEIRNLVAVGILSITSFLAGMPEKLYDKLEEAEGAMSNLSNGITPENMADARAKLESAVEEMSVCYPLGITKEKSRRNIYRMMNLHSHLRFLNDCSDFLLGETEMTEKVEKWHRSPIYARYFRLRQSKKD